MTDYAEKRTAYARGWIAAERHRETLDAATAARRHNTARNLSTSDAFTAAWKRGYMDGAS